MRSLALVVFLAGCPKAPEPKCPEQPAPVQQPVAPPVQTVKAPELDDQAVVSQSHAFLDAHDKAEVGAFKALASTGFVQFIRGRTYDLQAFEARLPARLAAKMPAWSRTCENERVFRAAHAATYVGICHVTIPASGDMPTTMSDFTESIVWVAEGETWHVAYWQQALAGVEAEREHWNETFRTGAAPFKKTANQFLIDVTRGRRPGTALDIATGQGRNVIYLAQQKWKVTGVDISDEGLKILKETAAAQKLKVTTVQEDIDKYDLGTGKWDLVTLIYAGDDTKLLERIKTSVRRGGMVVVEFFHVDATKGTGIGAFETGELAKVFAGWKIVRDEVVEDVADWGLRKTKLVRFAAEKP